MNRFLAGCCSLLGALALLVACNPTRLIGTWQDENYHGGRFQKVLVLAVTDEGALRRISEQTFVEQLRDRGVQALSSAGIFPADRKLSEDDILGKVGQFGVDALIVTRIVHRQQETEQRTEFSGPSFYDEPWRFRDYDRYYGNYYNRTLRPPYYSDWYGYYSHSLDYAQSRTYVDKYQIITAETNLYDANSGDLVWTALAETTVYGSSPGDLKAYSQKIADELVKAGLL